jgi:hypothetical protein
MKNIQVSDEIFLRLQSLAEPFVDTPETVIVKALDAFEKKVTNAEAPFNSAKVAASHRIFKGLNELPSMAHTRPVSFYLDSKKVTQNKWNALNHYIHIAVAKLVGIERLVSTTKANLKKGRVEGFDFIDDLGCSIQRSDSDLTVKQIAHLVYTFDLDCEIKFEWKDNGKSQFSGQNGKIVLNNFSKGL